MQHQQHSMMILIAGPYRSGTGDDPEKMSANVKAMESFALSLFRAGHIPILGEWFALPLVELASSERVGDAAFNEIFHPIAERLVSRCDAVLRIGGASTGADEMVRLGKSLGLKIFYSLEEVSDAVNGAEDLSEENIRKNCPHCAPTSQAFSYPLMETANFHVVCDVHDLQEGHILIIPKAHLSCIADYPPELFEEFIGLYRKVTDFVCAEYGSVATFEHGKYGQTVFHSHVHVMPFEGRPEDIVPEGLSHCRALASLALADLRALDQREGGYLYLSIGEKMWTVDPALAAPRFFRDRIARAIGRPERGSWKDMRRDSKLMWAAKQENRSVQMKWRRAEAGTAK